MSDTGKVFLIGSGPGDRGLITMKAVDLIKRAEVVIYDNLINKEILHEHLSESCESIYVGKSGSSHTMEQDDINLLIVKKARENKLVIRLKGGDPYIFGRGGEEALVLAEHNVPFEIVNGISSAYAVPAFAGIPVTHRGLSASVAFITGHEDPTKENSDIQWDKLSTGVQTLVFLMGVKNLPIIMSELKKNGRSGKTPVAVIQNGTYPSQRTVTGTIDTIIDKVKEAGIRPPSIIVVGEVVALREKINWFEQKPLFGKKIVVTRSREQASALVSRLEELGADILQMPTIKIEPIENADEINKSIDTIGEYNWIIFTSVNGVKHFFLHLKNKGLDSRGLCKNKICAIGPATADSLRNFGIEPDLVPEKFISTEISSELKKMGEVEGKSYLLPRADIAPEALRMELLESGASTVDDITVYNTVSEDFDDTIDIKYLIEEEGVDMVTFTSSSTSRNFSSILSKNGISVNEKITCASIGPITSETARKEGFNIATEARTHTIDGLVQAILDYFSGE